MSIISYSVFLSFTDEGGHMVTQTFDVLSKLASVTELWLFYKTKNAYGKIKRIKLKNALELMIIKLMLITAQEWPKLHDREGNMGKYQLEGDSIGPSAARHNTEPESWYFPILPDPWSAIIDLLQDLVQIRKVAEPWHWQLTKWIGFKESASWRLYWQLRCCLALFCAVGKTSWAS